MNAVKTDVIIPAYHPGEEFDKLLERLSAQKYPVNKIIVMNTEKKFWRENWEQKYPLVEVHHLTKQEFDHGATRRRGAELSDAEILIFMTQDALPADRNLVGNLVQAVAGNEKTGAAYARQLPKNDCGFLEKYTRSFNYPEQSCLKTEKDVETRGIKTYFCSNVCAAYKRDIFEQLGGFVNHTIFNEDMIYAAGVIQAGYAIAYAADAKVIHSHNYSGWQQFTRNFDLGVSHVQYPAVFDGVPPEGEGMKLVKKTAVYLAKTAPWLLPKLIWQSGMKWLGYRFGKKYQKLPPGLVRFCSLQKGYWKQEKE